MTQAPDLSGFTKEEIKEIIKDVRHPFEVAVYDSSNYFNMGSIIRTSHNFLAGKIHAVNLNDFYGPAASVSKKFEDINYISLEEFIKSHSGRSIVAMERRPPDLKSEDLRTFVWPESPIMFFGSEKFGCPDEILNVASSVVSIPMFGLINDFNVAVASGIVMYDWVSKFYTNGKKM